MIKKQHWDDYTSSNSLEENQRFFLYVGEALNNCHLKNEESLDRIFQEWMDERQQERLENRAWMMDELYSNEEKV